MNSRQNPRDHGGGLDAAVEAYGGTRDSWLDLSTGINPVPYPVPPLVPQDWTALPDRNAAAAVLQAARSFWQVPEGADILAAPGASALIARIPALAGPGRVAIAQPTYNEHAAAFTACDWQVVEAGPCDAQVVVHPNNPDGRLWSESDLAADLTVIDESFCDVAPAHSLVHLAARPGVIVLKSFGKFWGLAGLRLGFAIASPEAVARLSDLLGPWPVSGPALRIGAHALRDLAWTEATRHRLRTDASRLDQLLTRHGATCVGGTDLFRLYHVDKARSWQDRLARAHVWSRVFPYSDHFLRLGLPAPDQWPQLEAAL